jgi:3(or 17)beta-hydroxysteroid dehydrogenase
MSSVPARGLSSKVALITGGGSGLGKAVAYRLAAEGARVVITDLESGIGAATASAGGFTFLYQDVRDEAQWAHVIQTIEQKFSRVDILVNNAGILGPMDVASPENSRIEDWRALFAVNVEGVFLGCRAVLPAMRRTGAGSIINISSIAALRATPFATAYGASKACVRHLTKSIAQYCAEQELNVRCNSVHPGDVRTPLWDKQAEEVARMRGVPVAQVIESARSDCPLGDFTLPADVAAAVSFLASDDARHVNGTMLIVDGGVANCESYGRHRQWRL